MKTLLLLSCLSCSLPLAALPWLTWPTVGTAQLTWGFWTVYDSELRAPGGRYQPGQDLALLIRYRRDIDREDLVEATDDQWQHLGFPAAQRAQWIPQLEAIWPDVAKGDRLGFVVEQGQGQFYYNGEAIGEALDAAAADAFIGIWLDQDTEYPEMRRGLTGQGG